MDRGDGDRPSLARGESSLSLVDRDTTTRQAAATAFDLPAFQTYLAALLPLVLGADEHHLDHLFNGPDFADRAAKWASDPSAGVVYVVKTRDEPDERDAGTFGGSTGVSRADQEIGRAHV